MKIRGEKKRSKPRRVQTDDIKNCLEMSVTEEENLSYDREQYRRHRRHRFRRQTSQPPREGRVKFPEIRRYGKVFNQNTKHAQAHNPFHTIVLSGNTKDKVSRVCANGKKIFSRFILSQTCQVWPKPSFSMKPVASD